MCVCTSVLLGGESLLMGLFESMEREEGRGRDSCGVRREFASGAIPRKTFNPLTTLSTTILFSLDCPRPCSYVS